jgi:hypothetical protein
VAAVVVVALIVFAFLYKQERNQGRKERERQAGREGERQGVYFLKVSLKAATKPGTSLEAMSAFMFAHFVTARMTGCPFAAPCKATLIDTHSLTTLEKT